MKVEIIKCLKDNFSYLLINEKNQNACVIDPRESKPIIDFVEKKNINLKFILIHTTIMIMLVEIMI